MKRTLLSIGLFVLFAAALASREYLIHSEIRSTEDQLRQQLSQTISNATSVERIRYLVSSSAAYDRYLEPVIQAAGRLTWPYSRNELILDWKREVHSKLDDLSHNRIAELQQKFKEDLGSVRKNMSPSLTRLYQILDGASTSGAETSCVQTVQDEMKSIREYARDQDQTVLQNVQTEGMKRIRQLRRNLRSMNAQQLGHYLSSGRFINEVEEPVMKLLLTIRQEELRTSVWNEFRKKFADTLSRKNDLQAKTKEIDELLAPVAQALVKPSSTAAKPAAKLPEELNPDFRDQLIETRIPIPTSPSAAGDGNQFEIDP